MRREEKKRYWKLNREERDKRKRKKRETNRLNREERKRRKIFFLRKSRERINRWQNLATTLVIT